MRIHTHLSALVGALLTLSLLVGGSAPGAAAASVLYVDGEAIGNDDGSSWADAYTDLQDALRVAGPGDEIWVAAGVYYPAADSVDPRVRFRLHDDVALYGGFAGTETERDQRDWEANVTVLSGDLDRDDAADARGVVTTTRNITGTNAYHVVTGYGVTGTAVLDGFVVTAGQSDWDGGGMFNRESYPTLIDVTFSGNGALSRGGGMHNYKSDPSLTNVTFTGNSASLGGGMSNYESSPSLVNVAFRANEAQSNGGGMYSEDSDPALANVTFDANQAGLNGGGMWSCEGSPTLTGVTFTDNYAKQRRGGGMYICDSSPAMRDVRFTANKAGLDGGGMYSSDGSPTLTNGVFNGNEATLGGGGMYSQGADLVLTNVTLTGNHALMSGGGMYNQSSNPLLTNVTITANDAENRGGGMFNFHSNPTLVNCILWGNSSLGGEQISNGGTSVPWVTYSDVEGGHAGEGNVDGNPLFADPASADQAPTTAGDYHLSEGSPAMDAGTNDVVTVATDLDGKPRILDGIGDGQAVVDMGAYESEVGSSSVYLPLVLASQ